MIDYVFGDKYRKITPGYKEDEWYKFINKNLIWFLFLWLLNKVLVNTYETLSWYRYMDLKFTEQTFETNQKGSGFIFWIWWIDSGFEGEGHFKYLKGIDSRLIGKFDTFQIIDVIGKDMIYLG